jgi:hypothetical protein
VTKHLKQSNDPKSTFIVKNILISTMFLNCLVALEKVTAPSFFQVHAFSLFQKPNLSSIFVNSFFISNFSNSCCNRFYQVLFFFLVGCQVFVLWVTLVDWNDSLSSLLLLFLAMLVSSLNWVGNPILAFGGKNYEIKQTLLLLCGFLWVFNVIINEELVNLVILLHYLA